MAKKKKSVDATGIHIENGDTTFEKVLNLIDGQTLINDLDKTVKVGLNKSKNEDIVLGYVKTTKRSGIPPAHDLSLDEYEKLRLNESQGLGYSNVFLYIKKHQILLYQFEQMGCYLPTFIDSINKFFYNSEVLEENLKIRNSIVIRKEAMDRILSFDKHKAIEFTIYNPKADVQDHMDGNDALLANIDEADALNANELTVRYALKGKKIDGMPSQIISSFLHKLSTFGGTGRNNKYNEVTKIEVEGYLRDPSSDKEYKDSIDLITDKFKKSITIDEPRVKGDTQIKEKILELESLYKRIKEELPNLEIMYPNENR